jgi:hypothetical protein
MARFTQVSNKRPFMSMIGTPFNNTFHFNHPPFLQ